MKSLQTTPQKKKEHLIESFSKYSYFSLFNDDNFVKWDHKEWAMRFLTKYDNFFKEQTIQDYKNKVTNPLIQTKLNVEVLNNSCNRSIVVANKDYAIKKPYSTDYWVIDSFWNEIVPLNSNYIFIDKYQSWFASFQKLVKGEIEYWFLDIEGSEHFFWKYSSVSNFNWKYALVWKKDNTSCYIDKHWNEYWQEFSSINNFYWWIAHVIDKNNNSLLINEDFSIIYEDKTWDLLRMKKFFDNSWIWRIPLSKYKENDSWVLFIDSKWNTLLNPYFKEVGEFHNGFAKANLASMDKFWRNHLKVVNAFWDVYDNNLFDGIVSLLMKDFKLDSKVFIKELSNNPNAFNIIWLIQPPSLFNASNLKYIFASEKIEDQQSFKMLYNNIQYYFPNMSKLKIEYYLYSLWFKKEQ